MPCLCRTAVLYIYIYILQCQLIERANEGATLVSKCNIVYIEAL